MELEKNDPLRAGAVAGPSIKHGKYVAFPVHTRFDALTWMVVDTSDSDAFGFGRVVRQNSDMAKALDGLVPLS